MAPTHVLPHAPPDVSQHPGIAAQIIATHGSHDDASATPEPHGSCSHPVAPDDDEEEDEDAELEADEEDAATEDEDTADDEEAVDDDEAATEDDEDEATDEDAVDDAVELAAELETTDEDDAAVEDEADEDITELATDAPELADAPPLPSAPPLDALDPDAACVTLDPAWALLPAPPVPLSGVYCGNVTAHAAKASATTHAAHVFTMIPPDAMRCRPPSGRSRRSRPNVQCRSRSLRR